MNWTCGDCIVVNTTEIINPLSLLPNCLVEELEYEYETPVAPLEPHPLVLKKGSGFICININSITKYFDEFQHFLLPNTNIVAMGVVESKLSETSKLQNFEIENYHMIRKDRERMGGGLLLYLSCCYSFTEFQSSVIFPHETELISIKIQGKTSKPIILSIIYKPPHVKIPPFITALTELLTEINLSGYESILMGDFNIDILPGSPERHLILDAMNEF